MSSTHHTASLQKRFVRIATIVVAIFVVVVVPLVIMPQLRLDLGLRLKLVPGENVETVVEGFGNERLIVVPSSFQGEDGRQLYSYLAKYLTRPAEDDGGTVMHDISSGQEFTIPLETIDYQASDDSGSQLLLRGERVTTHEVQAVLIDLEKNTFQELSEGQETPDDDPIWKIANYDRNTGWCSYVSPSRTMIACVKPPTLQHFLIGDWQIDLQKYGDYHVSTPLVRGRGFAPFMGFSADGKWLYYQNDVGIFRAPIPDGFPPA